MARGAVSGRGRQVWFGRRPCGLEPRWKGHGHLSLVTGPDSRVASYVGGMVQISLETACGHHPSTLSPAAGRALSATRARASIWPISQAKAPLCGGLAGRRPSWQAAGKAGQSIAASHTSGMEPGESRPPSLRLAGAWLPWPRGCTLPSGLTAA